MTFTLQLQKATNNTVTSFCSANWEAWPLNKVVDYKTAVRLVMTGLPGLKEREVGNNVKNNK